MLAKILSQARETMGPKKVQVLADRGYFKIEEIKATVEQDITPYAPK
jgi:hypothetical protein